MLYRLISKFSRKCDYEILSTMKKNLTYEELFEANVRLQEENNVLKDEIKHLKMQLHIDDKPQKSIVVTRLSLEEKVALFRELFHGRKDIFARRWYSKNSGKSGYQPVCLNEWDRQLCDKRKYKCTECPNRHFKELSYEDVYRHLEGKDIDGCDIIGVYAILPDNKCNFLCADFDDKSCEHGYQNDVLSYINVCKEWKIPHAIERSRSGNGAHVWIFFETSLEASKARKLGNTILTEAMERNGRMTFKSYDRFFPNQDRLPEGGFGNLVALPLQGKARKEGNSVFVDENFMPYEDQWTYLVGVQKVPEILVDRILLKHGITSELGDLSTTSEAKPWETPSTQKIAKEDFPKELLLIKSNMLYIPLEDLSAKAINHLKRIASFKNPEFYAKLGMRLSTYNVPRIISCAEPSDKYIALPRGCEDAITNLLDENHVSYRMNDQTELGTPISVQFKGELREEQVAAIKNLIPHNNGVLYGTTAFGKTVAAIGLIVERKVNTLILVHTKALLDQWRTRLEEYLMIDYKQEDTPHKRGRKKVFSPFGTLDSKGNNLHSMVDIALMQSCFEENDIKPFIRNYGMVIVDECHHVSAVNFERILKYSNARYVYGLTATPIRKDGHQPIIFMQCGPIRYSADAKTQMASQTFERLLIPRFTNYRELTDDKKTYTQTIQGMSNDICRNTRIIDDVCKALQDGRSPIILTNLTSHVEILATMLTSKCKNVITLVGSESVKEKRLKMERLQNIPRTELLAIVATGKYVGEGFDYPRLDTLFLTLPVSWKGIVAQYAGRLHREYPGKKDVIIYDYIDIHLSLCDTMYKRRLKGYAAVGYKLSTINPTNLFHDSPDIIFNGMNFLKPFLSDLSCTRKSVVISSSKLWFSIRTPTLVMLQELTLRGVQIIVFVKCHSEKDELLKRIGVKVIAKENLSLHITVIDKSLIWYGSVNYLGYNTEEDNAIRISESVIAEEMLELLYNNKKL